jgi:MFS family permease
MLQLFLAQGLGQGLGAGLIYIPALGITAHHFKRKRSLAMGIVAAGSSLGGVIHPIMLNQLIYGRVGFAWGVRISAFFNLALLVIANFLMSTRLPPKKNETLTQRLAYWRGFLSDWVFLIACIGTLLFSSGGFFPVFFLQLEAVKRGVSATLAFYAVL